MGVDSNKPPPLPAPTETDSITPTELATDVSRPNDESSHYSLPSDGTPVTIKTRGHRANRSQTSLLIEYFEGGKPGDSSSVSRKPSVRVRLTPSKKHRHDHIQITETKSSSVRKASLTRRVPQPSTTASSHLDVEALEGEDGDSMRSYASATEESNVSKNPIDIEIDRSVRRRRPASPLIPDVDAAHESTYLPPNLSEISAIPNDSFLDGSPGSTVLTKSSETRRSKSTSRGGEVAAGVAGAMAGAAAADQVRSKKRHSGERRVSGEKLKDKDRKHRSSKSRTSSISEKQSEAGTRSPRRRSSRNHVDSLVSGADSSVLSSSISPSHRSYDQSSVRSGASKSSINNPKLLETVEDAIRRLILPELSALKREQSKRESRRSSLTSTGTGTSLSREDLGVDRRRSDKRSESGRDSRHRERRDREARHEYTESPRSIVESVEGESVLSVEDTPRRSNGALKAAAGGAAVAGLAAAALDATSPPADDRRQRRRRRADGSARSRSLGREKYNEEFEEEEVPAPPMPLMSEINPSEMTRTSILSVDSLADRPHSAMEEKAVIQEVARGNTASAASTPTPTQTPAAQTPTSNLQVLGTKHANVSHGDLRELSRTRTGELTEQREVDDYSSPNQSQIDDYDDYDDRSRAVDGDGDYDDASHEFDYYNTQDVPPPLKYVPYQPERRGLSPIYSVSGYTEAGSETAAQRDSRMSHGTASPTKSHPSQPDMRALSPSSSIPSNVMGRGFDEQSEFSVIEPGHGFPHSELTQNSEAGYRQSEMTQDSEPGYRQSELTQDSEPGYRQSELTQDSEAGYKQSELTQDSEAGYRNSQLTENSDAGYRNSQYTEGSDVLGSGQAVRGIVANPNIIHVAHGVESNVASLIDGSMLDQSIMTTGSGYEYGRDSQVSYGDSNVSYDDQPSKLNIRSREVSPEKGSVASHREFFEQRERESSRTPTSSRQSRSREFNGEYDLDEYGRKVAPLRYKNSPSTSTRHSPTASEKAIAAGAVGAAAAALKAAKDRKQPTVEEVDEEQDEWVGDGIGRNKSFKQRTMEGREPNHTPAHSVDRLDLEDQPKMGASAMPALHDPMPEVGYVDDDALTNPSLVREPLGGSDNDDHGHWPGDVTPRQSDVGTFEEYSEKHGHGLGMAAAGAAAGAAVGAALAHHRQSSQEHEDEWRRTSAERKRDTVITNPYDGASPIDNPDLLGARGFDDAYDAHYHGSPGHKNLDEGYISQGPLQSPNGQPKGKAIMPFNDPGAEDPFYMPQHARHLSGMSQGMASPLYDASTGNGIDSIESKDIIALMQHLMVRDAQRSARDTEILVTLVRSAAEMRNSFEDLKKLLANTEDVIIKEVQENTEETVKNVIGGPRPYPGSLPPRSIKGLGGAASQHSTLDETTKKSNFFRKALKGLSNKGTNDLGRIEDMLNQLLSEVDTLKAQTVRPGGGQSYENLAPEMQYEQDRGYEPEGQAGTSSTSHGSGMSSFAQSRGPSKMGYEPNRISTVHEDNEDDYHQGLQTPRSDFQRADSMPLSTPPQQPHTRNASMSNENTPKTEKAKKHKSRGSSSWFPKISRWSESTATSVGKAFRMSGSSKKDQEEEFLQHPPSRSGSDFRYDDRYQDDYQSDQLHSGFSQQDLVPPQRLETIPPAPGTYMTPEDPKYKAHRNSVNLQHPQPRQGQTERFKAALESQAYEYDTPMSPNTADWAGSATSLNRLPANANNRYSNSGAGTGEYWNSSPAGPPRPPKEPIDDRAATPSRVTTPSRATTPSKARISKLASKTSPLPYNSVESGYGTGPGTQPSNYTDSPKLENRNLNAALGMPTRRPSGPRAMTPKSAEEEAAREERRRKRDTFGTVASNETDTF